MTDWDDVDNKISKELEKVIEKSKTYKSTLRNLQNYKERLRAAIRNAERELKISKSKKLLEVINYFESAILQIDSLIIWFEEINDTKDQWIPKLLDKENSKNKNYIKWLKSDESRKQFIDALKEHNLIESRETETIINNHFKPQREQHGKPEPIQWLDYQTLLAYMIEQLDNNFIHTDSIWVDTAPHFSVNGKEPKNLRQSAKNYKDNKKGRAKGLIGKPKNHELVDKIIKSLPE